jgi:colanic acid biosynthesis glycosyl transferase WcaI
LKLYLINRFFWPDFSATSQMLTDLASGLAGSYNITVVTSRALYNDPLARDPERLRRMGANARKLFDAQYAKHLAIAKWQDVLEQALAGTHTYE